jgi:hypothetical protein
MRKFSIEEEIRTRKENMGGGHTHAGFVLKKLLRATIRALKIQLSPAKIIAP